ncbi:MAG: hypothetical protein AAGG75_25385, partial [Bacteroidota bacterium]
MKRTFNYPLRKVRAMKNCYFQSLIGLFILFLTLPGYTQDNSFNPFADVVPLSPTASSLAKYGDIPVGLHTGTPEINIPIHTLTGKNISVPISLSYHASGMRVEELASWVGFGWSLNAGGVISRTVRGKPDEEANGYIFSRDLPSFDAPQSELCDYFLNEVEDLEADSEPDIFYFNVNGYSGEFFFDQNGMAHTVPYQNVIITRLGLGGVELGPQEFGGSEGTRGFKLVTPDGMQYIFGLTGINGVDNWERSFSIGTCNQSANILSSDIRIATTSWF